MTAAFTLRLDDDTLKALDRLAEKTDRSRSWLAARAIEDYIALNAWQIEKIEAGIKRRRSRRFRGRERGGARPQEIFGERLKTRWTRPALADLEAIGDFVARDNPNAADRIVMRIVEAVEILRDHPHLGRTGRIAGTRELVIAGNALYRSISRRRRRHPDSRRHSRRPTLAGQTRLAVRAPQGSWERVASIGKMQASRN